jgi:hypothetical protein
LDLFIHTLSLSSTTSRHFLQSGFFDHKKWHDIYLKFSKKQKRNFDFSNKLSEQENADQKVKTTEKKKNPLSNLGFVGRMLALAKNQNTQLRISHQLQPSHQLALVVTA